MKAEELKVGVKFRTAKGCVWQVLEFKPMGHGQWLLRGLNLTDVMKLEGINLKLADDNVRQPSYTGTGEEE